MTYSVSRATVEAFYAAYSVHNAHDLAPFLHDDVEWTISGPVDVLPWCGVRRGKAAVLELVGRDFPNAMRVVGFTHSSILIDGDQVATLNRLTARRSGDGRMISYRVAHFMRFEGNKVISNLSLVDSFDAVEQILGHALDCGVATLQPDNDIFAV